MRVLERIELIDRIGRELQSRMTFADIAVYLGAYGVKTKDIQPSSNSKWVYVKELLADSDENIILSIAEELELNHSFSSNAPKEATFWKTGHFKLFLSHLASFKSNTAKLQQVLKKYAITSFVAHEDIEPTKDWQIEIETALHSMDAMVAILMDGFKESNWCDQEVGFAVGKNVLIIPVRKGLDPYGFIGKYQGIQANDKNIGQVAEEIFQTIVKSTKTRGKILSALSNAITQSTNISEASEKVFLLQSVQNIPLDVLENIKKSATENTILINSPVFINTLNKLFSDYSIDKLNVGGEAVATKWNDDVPF
ncbi:MAG: toll/interleukin-1 receptor domain-containing protein [Sulfurimonas sp.]|uniref:toll/interleukin-1 receptor domain-containing protein n=1 Tax=Sulfurimonas sp. TaxID=2022749 RepID=UPI00262494D1|nr:toll/interleukin-1 receptor domain-containing protein [Sulfurimonas sp.]MDD3476457.1 toll/interleukin-1 receptor domain-containing protein [Sulfurimonas sp.]